MFNFRGEEIVVARNDRINVCGNRRTEQGSVVCVADETFAFLFLGRDGDHFQRQKCEGKEGFERGDLRRKFAVEYPPHLVDILLANDTLIGRSHRLDKRFEGRSVWVQCGGNQNVGVNLYLHRSHLSASR